MSEFEAFNEITQEWEIFPISKLMKIKNNPDYSMVVVNEWDI